MRKGTDRAERPSGPPTLRPIGDRVLVLFDQSDWRLERGIVVQNGIVGVGYRMDGMVVGAGPKAPEGVVPGVTAYADPRVAEVVKMGDTRFHLFRGRDILAVAEADK